MSEFTDALAARSQRLAALEAGIAALGGSGASGTPAATASRATRSAGERDFRTGMARDTVSDSAIVPLEARTPAVPFITWSCRSLSGTAELCGYSGYSSDDSPYDAMDPEHWEGQYRKWDHRKISGAMAEFSYTASGCTGDIICYIPASAPYPAVGSWSIRFEGTGHRDCAGTRDEDAYSYTTTFDAACVETEGAGFPTDAVGNLPSGHTITTTLTSRTFVGVGCQEDTAPFTNRASYATNGEAAEELEDEVYLFDLLAAALAGGAEDVTEDDDCCTTISSAGLTTPESLDPISISGTAVRVTIVLFSLPPGEEFLVSVTLTQGTDDTIVVIGVRSMVTTYYYPPLAAPGDDPICVTDVALYSAT